MRYNDFYEKQQAVMPKSVMSGKTKPDSFPEADHRMSERIRLKGVISYSRPNVIFYSKTLCITSVQLTNMSHKTEI